VDHLYEAKLIIVGEGGAGKNSLAQKIKDLGYQSTGSRVALSSQKEMQPQGMPYCPILCPILCNVEEDPMNEAFWGLCRG
jgi:ABC-type glutathione transport system ATPase component